MKRCRMKNRDGYTLVELITVLTVLSVLSAVVLPSLIGFIGKTRERMAVAEAYGVCRSFQAYRILRMEGEGETVSEALRGVIGADLSRDDCPLCKYLTVTCTKGARISSITLGADGEVLEMVYQAGSFCVTVGEDHPEPIVKKIKSSGGGRLKAAKNLI